jgi:hypothetical protein
LFSFVVPFLPHQIPFNVEDDLDSDEVAESQNEDDQPSNSPKDENEGKVDIKLNCFQIVDISFMQLGFVRASQRHLNPHSRFCGGFQREKAKAPEV